jgi:hypothetical protein
MAARSGKPAEAKSGSAEAKPAEPASAASSPEPAASARSAAPGAEPADKPPVGDDAGQQGRVTVVPGVPRYHDENCILIRFMGDDDLQRMSLGAATAAGCTPCRACQPDD